MDSYLPWLIGGWHVLVQNVYVYQVGIWDTFRTPETWIYVHFFVPYIIGFLSTSVRNGLQICYGWETFEHILMGLFMDKNILGTESAMDSVVGDILQGFTGVLWAHTLKAAVGIPAHYIWGRRTFVQRSIQIALIVLVCLSANLATLILVVDPDKPIYYSSIADWSSRPINTYAVGFVMWLALGFLFLAFFERSAINDLPELADKIHGFFFATRILHLILSIACCTLWIPTYYTFWAVQPVLFGIIYFLYYYDNPERAGLYTILANWIRETFVERCEIIQSKEKK